MLNYYEILGVVKEATAKEIKQAYHSLAREHHPDKGGSKEEFQKIQLAYNVLSNPKDRERYDSGVVMEQSPHDVKVPNFEDILNSMGGLLGDLRELEVMRRKLVDEDEQRKKLLDELRKQLCDAIDAGEINTIQDMLTRNPIIANFKVLEHAIGTKQEAIIDLILANEHLQSARHESLEDSELGTKLFRQCLNKDSKVSNWFLTNKEGFKSRFLHKIIKEQDQINVNTLDLLLKKQLIDVNMPQKIYLKKIHKNTLPDIEPFDMTPLSIALFYNNESAIKLLLKANAQITQSLQLPNIRYLNAQSHYPNESKSVRALLHAAAVCSIYMIQLLLDNGHSIHDVADNDGHNIFSYLLLTERMDLNKYYYYDIDEKIDVVDAMNFLLKQRGITEKVKEQAFLSAAYLCMRYNSRMYSSSLCEKIIEMLLDRELCTPPTIGTVDNAIRITKGYGYEGVGEKKLRDYKSKHFRFNWFLLRYHSTPKFPTKDPWYSYAGLKEDLSDLDASIKESKIFSPIIQLFSMLKNVINYFIRPIFVKINNATRTHTNNTTPFSSKDVNAHANYNAQPKSFTSWTPFLCFSNCSHDRRHSSTSDIKQQPESNEAGYRFIPNCMKMKKH